MAEIVQYTLQISLTNFVAFGVTDWGKSRLFIKHLYEYYCNPV